MSGSRVRSFRHGLGQPGSGRHGGIGVCVGCQDINGFHQPWRLSSGDTDRVFDMFFLDLYDKLCSFKGPSRRSFSWHSFSNSSNNTFGSPSSFWAASRTHGCDLRSLIGKASFHEFYHPSLTVNLSCGKCFSHFGTTEVSVSNIPEGIADCSSRSRWNTNISWKSIRTFLLKMP